MRRPATILIAGAILAAPLLAPLSAAATSPVDNTQVNLGNVFSDQTLNVDVVSDTTAATTTATGNALLTGVDSDSLTVTSAQTNTGGLNAYTQVNVSSAAGATVINTVATGNTAEADSTGGGTLTGAFTQVENGPLEQSDCRAQNAGNMLGCVKSENDFNAASPGQADSASVSSQAIANSLTFGISGGASDVTTVQSNTATVVAESGSEVGGGATLGYTPGAAAFSSIAVANNITATGDSGANQTINATQTASGYMVLASQFVNLGNGQTIQGAAAATGNNVSATNVAGDLNITNVQVNDTGTTGDGNGEIQAISLASGFEFGSGQATASGVGNALLAANYGPTTEVDNTQVNNGRLQVSATFDGGNTIDGQPSYDASASATAIGNGATGFACTACGGVINASNTQTNTGGVGASTSVTITGANRSVASVATAVGNSATYYASRPSN